MIVLSFYFIITQAFLKYLPARSSECAFILVSEDN